VYDQKLVSLKSKQEFGSDYLVAGISFLSQHQTSHIITNPKVIHYKYWTGYKETISEGQVW